MHQRGASIGSSAFGVYAALAALACAAAGSSKAPAEGVYSGQTADKMAVSLRLSSDRRYVKRLAIRYKVTCDNGATGKASAEFLDVAIQDGGKFAYKGTYRKRSDRSRNTLRVRGKVTKKEASGTFSLKAVGRPKGSKKKVHCRSGEVTWSAKPAT
jgi:hypothetical protein